MPMYFTHYRRFVETGLSGLNERTMESVTSSIVLSEVEFQLIHILIVSVR